MLLEKEAAPGVTYSCAWFEDRTRIMAASDFFLFVSHVAEDRPAALEIVAELERRGVRCWIAPRDVRVGRPFDDEIVEAI